MALSPYVHTPEARRKAKHTIDTLPPDEHKKFKEDLDSVHAVIRVPQNMRLETEHEVMLVIDPEDKTDAKESTESDGVRTIPVEIKISKSKPVNQVAAWLSPVGTKAKVTGRHAVGEDKLDVAPEGETRWTWVVEPQESGTLRLEVATFVTIGSPPRSTMHFNPDKDIPLDVAFIDRFWNMINQVWLVATTIASGVVTFASGLGCLHLAGKWRQRAGDVELST